VAEQWFKALRGWSGVLVGAAEFQDGVRWLQLFAEFYGDAVDGTVVGQTRSSGGFLGRQPSAPVTAVAYSTGDLTQIPSDDRGPLWFVDPEVTKTVLAAAQDWVVTPDSRTYVTRDGGYWGLEIRGLDWRQGWADAISRYANATVVARRSKPTRMRKVELWPHGRVSYSDHDPSTSLRERLVLAREPLAFAVENTDLAFVAYQDPSSSAWRPNLRGSAWAFVDEADVRYNRPLLASMVPDAHGIQMLTTAHLERANDLSDWTVTDVGSGRYLVEARSLDQWYEGPGPDLEVLEKARADFGDMIMTHDLIEENSPWLNDDAGTGMNARRAQQARATGASQ
jgi:hypothetical protein